MRRIIALALCLMMFTACAFAEGGLTMTVDTDEGSFLLSEDGKLLTQPGEYDVIYCFTYDPCEPERLMYGVTNYDDAVIPYDGEDGDVADWPDDGGELPEGDDADESEEEWEDSVEFSSMDAVTDKELDSDSAEPYDGELEGDDWDFDGEYFDALYAVMNARGELITGFDYIAFTHDVHNALIFATRADGFVDVLNEQGDVLMISDYAVMASDGNGGYFATKPDLEMTDEYGDFSNVSKLVHVSADGQESDTGYSTGTYELGAFESGYICVPLYEETAAEESADEFEDIDEEFFVDYEYYDYTVLGYVYLDANGVNVFDKVFSYATMFIDGYAEVEDEDFAARLIDVNGNYVTDKEYSGFDRSEDDDNMPIIANYEECGFDLLSRDDLSVIASFGSEYGDDLFAAQAGGDFITAHSDSCMMILDGNGRVLYTSQNSDVYAYTWYSFCEGQPERILISDGDWPNAECSLMDLQGNSIGGAYPELIAMSWKDGQGRYMVADFEIVEVEYDGETMQDADYDTYRYGMIDQDGNTVLETKYTMINCLSADRFWISDGSVYQLVDANGSVIFETE